MSIDVRTGARFDGGEMVFDGGLAFIIRDERLCLGCFITMTSSREAERFRIESGEQCQCVVCKNETNSRIGCTWEPPDGETVGEAWEKWDGTEAMFLRRIVQELR